jgi:hypothetical protein
VQIGLSPKGLGGEEQAGIRRERKAREGHGQEGRQGGAKQNESPFIPKVCICVRLHGHWAYLVLLQMPMFLLQACIDLMDRNLLLTTFLIVSVFWTCSPDEYGTILHGRKSRFLPPTSHRITHFPPASVCLRNRLWIKNFHTIYFYFHMQLQKQVETGRSSNFHPSGDAPREAELKSGTRSYAPLLPFRPGLEQRNGEGNGSNGSVEVTAEDHFKVSNGRHSARHNPSLPGEIARQANEWKGGDDPGALGGLPSPLRPAIRVDNAGDGGSPLPSPMRRVTFNKHHISVQFSDEGSEKEGDKIPVFSHSGHSPGSGYGKRCSLYFSWSEISMLFLVRNFHVSSREPVL